MDEDKLLKNAGRVCAVAGVAVIAAGAIWAVGPAAPFLLAHPQVRKATVDALGHIDKLPELLK